MASTTWSTTSGGPITRTLARGRQRLLVSVMLVVPFLLGWVRPRGVAGRQARGRCQLLLWCAQLVHTVGWVVASNRRKSAWQEMHGPDSTGWDPLSESRGKSASAGSAVSRTIVELVVCAGADVEAAEAARSASAAPSAAGRLQGRTSCLVISTGAGASSCGGCAVIACAVKV